MQDVVFIGLGLGFMAACAAYVRGLDRIVRSAEESETAHESRASAPAATPFDAPAERTPEVAHR